jgi:hypothetical protein
MRCRLRSETPDMPVKPDYLSRESVGLTVRRTRAFKYVTTKRRQIFICHFSFAIVHCR